MESSASGWRVRLFDCWRYTDAESGRCICVPHFFPQALCSPCCLVGAIETATVNESYINCCLFSRYLRVGRRGLCMCLLTAPLSLCTPFAYAPSWLCFAFCQRARLMRDQGIGGGCFELSKACCAPCAMFQHFVQLRETGRERRRGAGPSGVDGAFSAYGVEEEQRREGGRSPYGMDFGADLDEDGEANIMPLLRDEEVLGFRPAKAPKSRGLWGRLGLSRGAKEATAPLGYSYDAPDGGGEDGEPGVFAAAAQVTAL